MQRADSDNLTSTEILPVRCPQCGEAQNTLDGATDPLSPTAEVGCMVCGHAFAHDEYLELLERRRREFASLRAGDA